MRRKAIKLSVIIVNYNGKKFLKDCLDSIYEQLKNLDHEVIIVDNNSSDESISFIKQYYPKISLIENALNVGFAAANNQGVRKATGDYILLLNNDTILMSNLNDALNNLDSNENVGAVGIKMLNGNEEYIPSFGKFPTPYNLLRISNLNYQFRGACSGEFENKDTLIVDWISGAFLLTKKSYWNEVNGLDEEYFMYVEDVDFCKKLYNIGLKTVYLPGSYFIHHVGFNSKRERLLIKGYALYASKHFNTFEEKFAKLLLYLNYAFKRTFKNIR